MERYVDKFVRECPMGEDESLADYLDRFCVWMIARGTVSWDDPVTILPNGEISGEGGNAANKDLGITKACALARHQRPDEGEASQLLFVNEIPVLDL